MGISGVPFFVVNNKYGISGAQPATLFTETINTAWKEFEKTHALVNMSGTDGTTAAG
jgi:predicted DsbA family dithiol-disulfide isomerase